MFVLMFPTINLPRCHLAAFLFDAARVTLFGAIRALRRGLLMRRPLFASPLNRPAFLVFGPGRNRL
jgi:hypothetical protein